MAPKIIVLDGYTLAPAHLEPTPPPTDNRSKPNHHHPDTLDWTPLQALGDLTVHDRTPQDQICQRAQDASMVLTNKTPFTAQTIAALPQLNYIGVLATGVNVVDLAAARQHNVTVTNVPGYSTDTVAQHVLALLLELINHTGAHNQAVRDGQWARCPDFSFTVAPIYELTGKTLGIVGMGTIGKRVARIGSALGMNIAAAHQSSMARVKLHGIPIHWHPIDELARLADVLTLHCPLTEQTRHLINAKRLATMKPTAILINTSRGPIVDEDALAAALHDNRIAAAGLDVLGSEPPTPTNPLLAAPRCVITPHIAWASVEAKKRLMDIAARNIQAFLDGSPTNVVN